MSTIGPSKMWGLEERVLTRSGERLIKDNAVPVVSRSRGERVMMGRNVRIAGTFFAEVKTTNGSIGEHSEFLTSEDATKKQENPPQRLYFKLLFDGMVEVFLSLEQLRERYPQLLIDFLLAQSVWT